MMVSTPAAVKVTSSGQKTNLAVLKPAAPEAPAASATDDGVRVSVSEISLSAARSSVNQEVLAPSAALVGNAAAADHARGPAAAQKAPGVTNGRTSEAKRFRGLVLPH